tara:strand:+ start:3204 stop:6842 length:3639 start_codon:yes stop_codon:yes gene_type:complete
MKRPVDLATIQKSLQSKISSVNEDIILDFQEGIKYLLSKKKRKDASNFFVASLRSIAKLNENLAIGYGEANIQNIPDSRAVKTLAPILMKKGMETNCRAILDLVGPSPWKIKIQSQMMKHAKEETETRKAPEKEMKRKSEFIEFTRKSKSSMVTRKFATLRELKVACVLDNFSYSAFRFEADFLQLDVFEYQNQLESFQPDIVFFESAWRGKDDLWGSKVGHGDREVIEILQWAQKNNVPSVFWNKEDPVHFKSFLNVAQLFDYVFTTDLDSIPRYKEILSNDNIFLLPFAFQPKLHNPIEEFDRISKMCFAGAYYRKYAQRNKDMESIMNGVLEKLELDIYDRNYLDDNPDYSFPESFENYIIGTLSFEDINLAYKGYDIGMNLNTIKNSPTMFARRVFELLASNTHVFSNYSRGVDLFFGDIVFSSDSGTRTVTRYLSYTENQRKYIRLSGLRKVFSDHTYRHRFEYIVNKISLQGSPRRPDSVLVVCKIDNEREAKRIIDQFEVQTMNHTELRLFSDEIWDSESFSEHKINNTNEIESHFFEEFLGPHQYLSVWNPEYSYGSNYLIDLCHATEYVENKAISKFIDTKADEGVMGDAKISEYRFVTEVPIFASLIPKKLIMNRPVIPNLRKWAQLGHIQMDGFVIDDSEIVPSKLSFNKPFNSENTLDMGIDYSQLLVRSEAIEGQSETAKGMYLSSAEVYQQICDIEKERVNIGFIDGKTLLHSNLNQGEHTYLYWSEFQAPHDIGAVDSIVKLHLDASPGLRLMLAVIFYDENRNKIGSDLSLANSNITFELPDKTSEIRVALRVYQQGACEINSIDFFHHSMAPTDIITRNQTLVVTNNYPSYDEKYRNGFLHSRVLKYRNEGLHCDVFVLKEGTKVTYREYEGTRVISGGKKSLSTILSTNSHNRVLVHFLDEHMWDVLKNKIHDKKILVWVHGSEIQPWHRRTFNYETEDEIVKAKIESSKRMDFWKPLLKNMPLNLKLIFVSKYFADEVMEDTGVIIPHDKFEIIHNPIDTEQFNFVKKDSVQRLKLLTIRPFASRKYANDLTVKAILRLSKTKIFKQLEIKIVGDGKLFDEIIEPLHKFDNITIDRGFLSHAQIADLHKQYGVFLTPTRMDSQGVSRDEAMSSGLVPITTSVTAIPEFVDDESGLLVPGEDHKAMADAVIRLVENPSLFDKLSSGAAKRVRKQSSSKKIIDAEIELITLEEWK